MKMLRITQCSDPLMWYAGLVGELVPYVGQWPEACKSLEAAGYLNQVRFSDVEIVELTDALARQMAEPLARSALPTDH